MRAEARDVRITLDELTLQGSLAVPDGAVGIVVFVHGSGSGRHSPRNRHVATRMNEAGLATLLFDLLTEAEEESERRTRHLRFDIGLLAGRLVRVTAWLRANTAPGWLPIGYFGASTGAAAALVASTFTPVDAVVSRGGRPDLAGDALSRVRAPTLLVVGGDDTVVLDLNRQALARLAAPKALRVVPGASHLFEEPGTLDEAAQLATDWFRNYLGAAAVSPRGAPPREASDAVPRPAPRGP